jgi:hypothetical protein
MSQLYVFDAAIGLRFGFIPAGRKCRLLQQSAAVLIILAGLFLFHKAANRAEKQTPNAGRAGVSHSD